MEAVVDDNWIGHPILRGGGSALSRNRVQLDEQPASLIKDTLGDFSKTLGILPFFRPSGDRGKGVPCGVA
jgi:hypothetical protein